MFRFSADFCPELADPIGGTQLCKDWGSGGQFKVCEISCNVGLRFSQEVPKFYTCGAEGFWRPTNDPSLPLIYPACTSKFSPSFYTFVINVIIILLFLFVQAPHPHNGCSESRWTSRHRFSATKPAKECSRRRFETLSTLWTEIGISARILTKVNDLFIFLYK